jgi:hypothetical protein
MFFGKENYEFRVELFSLIEEWLTQVLHLMNKVKNEILDDNP